MIADELKEIQHKDLDAFFEKCNEIFKNGSFYDVAVAVALSFRSEKMLSLISSEPMIIDDATLAAISRTVWKKTNGSRNMPNLLGADDDSPCRRCKFLTCGAVCSNKARRASDLASGEPPELCTSIGRRPFFLGNACNFFEEAGAEAEEIDEA